MKLFGLEIRYDPGPDRVDYRVADLLDRVDRVRAEASAMVDGYTTAITLAGQAITKINAAVKRLSN